MLKLLKNGSKLDSREINSIYGGGADDCGSNQCNYCGNTEIMTTFATDYKAWVAVSNG